MKKVVLNQNENPVISKSLNGRTHNGAQFEDAFTANKVSVLGDANPLSRYNENLLHFKKRQILNKNGHLRIKDSCFDSKYVYQLNELLAEYLMTHFTLFELYVLFFQYQSVYGFDVVKEAKRVAIESIDSETELLTINQIKRLKKMVWDMNQIWFGLILNFVMVNNLFWDEETQIIIRPEFKMSK